MTKAYDRVMAEFNNLPSLSREIADTSSEWMLVGVTAVKYLDDPKVDDESAYFVFVGKKKGESWLSLLSVGPPPNEELRPDLHNQITVNCLLGDGEVWIVGDEWLSQIGAGKMITAATRTTAICLAWLSAHKVGNNERATT